MTTTSIIILSLFAALFVYFISELKDYHSDKNSDNSLKAKSISYDDENYIVVPVGDSGYHLYGYVVRSFCHFFTYKTLSHISIDSEIDPDFCGYITNYLAKDIETIDKRIEEIKQFHN